MPTNQTTAILSCNKSRFISGFRDLSIILSGFSVRIIINVISLNDYSVTISNVLGLAYSVFFLTVFILIFKKIYALTVFAANQNVFTDRDFKALK